MASTGLRRLADDGSTTALEKELKAEARLLIMASESSSKLFIDETYFVNNQDLIVASTRKNKLMS